jgi:hypothetical protein
MDLANEYRQDILTQADVLERLLPRMDATAKETARRWRDMRAFDFIGSGFDYAAAFYGHAKILEATGKHSSCVDSEEWLHLNFSCEISRKRARSSCQYDKSRVQPRQRDDPLCRRTGRPLLVVTDGELEEPIKHGTIVLVRIRHADYDAGNAVCTAGLLAGYLSEEIGEEYGRGCKGPWQFADGAACIRNSIS